MHERPALVVFLQQLNRVLPWMNDPENIHLVMNSLWVCLLHEQVEKRSAPMRLEFVPVSVIKELDSIFCEDAAGFIENSGCRAALFFIEIPLMRNPGTSRVLQAERFCIASYAFGVVAIAVIRKVATDGF